MQTPTSPTLFCFPPTSSSFTDKFPFISREIFGKWGKQSPGGRRDANQSNAQCWEDGAGPAERGKWCDHHPFSFIEENHAIWEDVWLRFNVCIIEVSLNIFFIICNKLRAVCSWKTNIWWKLKCRCCSRTMRMHGLAWSGARRRYKELSCQCLSLIFLNNNHIFNHHIDIYVHDKASYLSWRMLSQPILFKSCILCFVNHLKLLFRETKMLWKFHFAMGLVHNGHLFKEGKRESLTSTSNCKQIGHPT